MTLQSELWAAIKNARDDAANDVSVAQQRLDELNALLAKMKAAGMSDHLPTIEEVQAAFRDQDVDAA